MSGNKVGVVSWARCYLTSFSERLVTFGVNEGVEAFLINWCALKSDRVF